MSAALVPLVAVAGGIGAALRFWLDGAITRRFAARVPLGTLVINVSGSLLLGLLSGASHALGASVLAVAGTGLMGGYTTFSTASVETVRLLRSGQAIRAGAVAFGMLVVSVAAAVAGLLLGRLA